MSYHDILMPNAQFTPPMRRNYINLVAGYISKVSHHSWSPILTRQWYIAAFAPGAFFPTVSSSLAAPWARCNQGEAAEALACTRRRYVDTRCHDIDMFPSSIADYMQI